MKKKIIVIFVLTIIVIFVPAFLVKTDTSDTVSVAQNKIEIDNEDINNEVTNTTEKNNNKDIATVNKNSDEEDITTFSSNTSFKKTYYISGDRVNVYQDNTGKDKIAYYLGKNDVVVAYKEDKGYIYCEDNLARKGWIRKNLDNLKGNNDKKTTYTLDVNLTSQKLSVYKDNKVIKNIICSTGEIGDQDTETPIGTFYVQDKGSAFFSDKYNQGGKYYIKFFANYLIHSIPVDKKGNIIEEESKKLGFPVSHGCVRIKEAESKWIYDNIPKGSKVVIHY